MDRSELFDARNVEFNDQGRLIARRGGQQVGDTLSGTIENGVVFVATPGGSAPGVTFLVNNMGTTAVLSKLLSPGRLATAITTSSTTVVLDSGTGTVPLAASGTIEIEGDLIAYTSKNGDNVTLEGVTGITSSHAAGAAVHQWATVAQSGTAVDARMGIYYASLNNILIINGRSGNIKQMDAGGTITDVSNEPAILFATNYRDRLYGAGDGSSGTNGSALRVSFSARGDGTSWTTASDWFDVFDQNSQYITGLKVHNDVLGIFKINSIFTYNEVELKQRVINAGAYNHKVIQEIDNSIFTFCPDGIFETNLYSAKQIGEPVRQYWQNFMPTYDATGLMRVVTNTWAATFKNSYYLYIGSVTDPDTTAGVVLEFNTKNRTWTVHNGGFTNFAFLNNFKQFRFGDGSLSQTSALFGGDSSGKVWRLFSNMYLNRDGTWYGSDIFKDLISNTGSPVSVKIETPLYDQGQPALFKTYKRLRVYAESSSFNVEYRVENELGAVSAYKPLGVVTKNNQTLDFRKDAQGYRVGLRISAVNTNSRPILNGFVLEDTEVVPRANAG